MKDLGNGMAAEVLVAEITKNKRVYLYAMNKGIREPSLILADLGEVQRLHAYLGEILKKNKRYE
jgi:hypothetical protein